MVLTQLILFSEALLDTRATLTALEDLSSWDFLIHLQTQFCMKKDLTLHGGSTCAMSATSPPTCSMTTSRRSSSTDWSLTKLSRLLRILVFWLRNKSVKKELQLTL